jgi:hypothetical protein
LIRVPIRFAELKRSLDDRILKIRLLQSCCRQLLVGNRPEILSLNASRKMGKMIGHDVRRLSGHNTGMDLGVEWFTPSKGRLCDVDVRLALVEFVDNLFHANTVATAEEIPVGEFGGRIGTPGDEACGKT